MKLLNKSKITRIVLKDKEKTYIQLVDTSIKLWGRTLYKGKQGFKFKHIAHIPTNIIKAYNVDLNDMFGCTIVPVTEAKTLLKDSNFIVTDNCVYNKPTLSVYLQDDRHNPAARFSLSEERYKELCKTFNKIGRHYIKEFKCYLVLDDYIIIK